MYSIKQLTFPSKKGSTYYISFLFHIACQSFHLYEGSLFKNAFKTLPEVQSSSLFQILCPFFPRLLFSYSPVAILRSLCFCAITVSHLIFFPAPLSCLSLSPCTWYTIWVILIFLVDHIFLLLKLLRLTMSFSLIFIILNCFVFLIVSE